MVLLTTRLTVLLTGLLGLAAIGYGPGAGPRPVASAIGNLPARWDAGWYASIAASGYLLDPSRTQQPIAFFPAFPMLMRVGGEALNSVSRGFDSPDLFGGREGRMLWSGLFVSLAAFTAALVCLYKLARLHGCDAGTAWLFLCLLSAYPFAVFFSAPYSEALFLLASTAAMYFGHKRTLAACFAAGVVAGLSRPNGFLLCVPVALVLFGSGRRLEVGRLRESIVAAAPLIGVALYSGFVYSLTGVPWGWAQAQAGWGGEFSGAAFVMRPLQLVNSLGLEGYILAAPIDALSRVAILFVLGMLWPVWRRLGAPYVALVVVYLIPALAIDLYAVGRMTAVLFPVFFALAQMLPEKGRYPCLVVFSLLQGLTSVLFFTFRSCY
jgi:hypothetical protein